ncbi:MAG TPA: P-loop NTPase [Planctomycetota bacterium]|jgi:ATP-binding protein involved in chromosome partitioning
MAVSENQVLDALRAVHDPDLQRDIVSLGFVKNVKICDGNVGFEIELTTPACPVKDDLKRQASDVVLALPGVSNVSISMTARTRGRAVASADILRGVKNIVAIASGKGGVGKSTATVNLALALAASGAKVGILDADVYGPSIPQMLGIREGPGINAEGQASPPVAFGVKVMSVAMLVSDDEAAIWRGPIVSRILQQFLSAVDWGQLDYLLLDLPPGTGDVQLTLTQSAPINGAVIITTPQDVALKVARRGLRMFQKVNVPVLGIIENMSGFVCPNCNTVHNIFRKGGGERTAHEMGVPMLGAVPLDPRMVEAGDAGKPLVVLDPNSPGAKAFEIVARNMAAQLSIANVKTGETHERPAEMHLHDQNPPSILWADGKTTIYNARELRLACPCAACRNEMTNEQIIKDADVPADIKIVETRPVGRYGQSLVFSDGHSSGIYANDMLKEMGKLKQ